MINTLPIVAQLKSHVFNSESEQHNNKFTFDAEHKLIYNLLIIGSLLCCTMFTVRMSATGHFYYAFLLWNLFLAWLPYFFAKALYNDHYKIFHAFYFVCWLAFFPNAPYLITDLVHLPNKHTHWYWFDQSMLVMFAINGLMLGAISLLTVHKYINKFLKRRFTWPSIFVLLFMCAYGVYLGRIERYNSWDIIATPISLAKNIWNDFRHPIQNNDVFIFTFVIAILLTIIYLFIVSLKYPELILKKPICKILDEK